MHHHDTRFAPALLSGLLLALGTHTVHAAPGTLAQDGDAIARCDSISGGKGTVTITIDAGCKDCATSDAASAADGQAGSFAGLKVFSAASTAQGMAIRATAQPGVVYPAGTRAGVFWTLPDNNPDGENLDSGGSTANGLHTYLAGKLQDSIGAPERRFGPVENGSEQFSADKGLPGYYSYLVTTKPFDAVELFVSDTTVTIANKDIVRKEVTVGAAPYKIYEICSDGGVSRSTR